MNKHFVESFRLFFIIFGNFALFLSRIHRYLLHRFDELSENISLVGISSKSRIAGPSIAVALSWIVFVETRRGI